VGRVVVVLLAGGDVPVAGTQQLSVLVASVKLAE